MLVLAATQTTTCAPDPCTVSGVGGSWLSYAAIGAIVAAIVAGVVAVAHEWFKNGLRRRGIARLLYHRLMQRQSTLALAYYRQRWWSPDEYRDSDLLDDDLKRAATAMRANEWRAVNSALGWAEYLRHRRAADIATMGEPDYEALRLIRATYVRIDHARWALRRVSGRIGRRMPWDVHNHGEMARLATCEGYDPPEERLAGITREQARGEMRTRRRSERMPCDWCRHDHEETATRTVSSAGRHCIGCRDCPPVG